MVCGGSVSPSNSTRRRRHGFTLIEILVVVAIIALLIAILIPSLARAREQARIVKCLTNMSNMPKAVLTFATEHIGYSQVIGTHDEYPILDPSRKKYDYQSGAFGRTGPVLKSWPSAYMKYVGMTTYKRMEQYFDKTFNKDPQYYYRKFGRHEIFICPSDEILVNNVWSPEEMYGIVSYAANEDVFGVTNPRDNEGQPWKDGRSGDTNPARAKRLEGKMDRIIRPSEVALFCDGGREDTDTEPALLITNNAGMLGPYLEHYEYFWHRLPHWRHGTKGGVAVAFADGSGKLAKPLQFTRDGQYVKKYAPRVRVSPYDPGVVKEIPN